jgi:hypothetical protein
MLPVWIIADHTGQQSAELGKILQLFTSHEVAEELASYPPLADKQIQVQPVATSDELHAALALFAKAGGVYVSIDKRSPTGSEGRIYAVDEMLNNFAPRPA